MPAIMTGAAPSSALSEPSALDDVVASALEPSMMVMVLWSAGRLVWVMFSQARSLEGAAAGFFPCREA